MKKSNAIIKRGQGTIIRTETKEIKLSDITKNQTTDYVEIHNDLEDELIDIVQQVKALKSRAEEIKDMMNEIAPLIGWQTTEKIERK